MLVYELIVWELGESTMACVVAQLSSFSPALIFFGHFLNFFVYKKLSKTAPGSPSNRVYQIGYNYKLANTKDILELDFFLLVLNHATLLSLTILTLFLVI